MKEYPEKLVFNHNLIYGTDGIVYKTFNVNSFTTEFEIKLSEEDELILDKLHFFILNKGEGFKNKLKQRLS